MLRIDLSRLNENVADRCEQVFQQKMNESDGKRCIIASSMVDGIDLTKPSINAQIILNVFANISCPFSCFRFAVSLYPFAYPTWPISSRELSRAYMFEAIEVVLNLEYDKKAGMIFKEFKTTREFISIMQIANEMLESMPISSFICSEVAELIEQYRIVEYCEDRGYKQ